MPPGVVGYGAAAIVGVSYWRLRGRLRPRPSPSEATREERAITIGRVGGLALLLGVLGAATSGDNSRLSNIAPVAVLVVFWAGLTILSGVVGDVWSRIDPFPVLAEPLLPVDEPPPYRLGTWPAAAGLLAFVWVVMISPNAREPRVLAVLIVLFCAVMLSGAARWGPVFLREGSPFRVWFGLLGRRSRQESIPAGALAVLLVALGAAAFDMMTASAVWVDLVGDRVDWALVPWSTGALLLAVGAVSGAYLVAAAETGRRVGRSAKETALRFAPVLVAPAYGYSVAHLLSVLLVDGQVAVILASDPVGAGWDLFGTASWRVNIGVISPGSLAIVQVVVITLTHAVAALEVRRRASASGVDERTIDREELPLLALILLSTAGGVAALIGS